MTIKDVISELNRIQAEGLIAEYAIGGGFGARAYMEAAHTEDIDVFVTVSGKDLHPLDPLRDVHAKLVDRGAKFQDLYLVIGGWPVQILPPGDALHDEAVLKARTHVVDGETLRIMTPEYLAATALVAGQPRHLLRVHEFLETGLLDLSVLTDLVERFNLKGRWDELQKRFPLSNAKV